ncbi:MAG: endolytic transglycosylase MltG [Candidatus Aegiribacteria sp.]
MKRKLLPAVLVVLLLAAAGAFVLRWCGSPPCGGRRCEFTVERGWGARTISRALSDSGLVRCRLYILWRYSVMEGAPPLQAGTYSLDDSMTPDSILGIIARGEVIPVATSWVTLAPGLTLEQSLEIISRSTPIDRDDLDSLARDRDFLDSLGVPSLEGYLYPETYEFADTLSAVEMLERIVDTGRSRWPGDLEENLEHTGLSPHETMILASIVEREARVDSERPLVAGVFLGRLRRGMRLESCATVQYALGQVREVLLYRDLEVDHPYNTYRSHGLPPGPICSPGSLSIHAAVHPDTSQGYIYFVSRDDGTGRHLFARTHAGHLANIRSIPDR